jgi:hypothetical protein
VGSSCEFGIESSGSIKSWETIEWPNNSAPCSSAYTVSLFTIFTSGIQYQFTNSVAMIAMIEACSSVENKTVLTSQY